MVLKQMGVSVWVWEVYNDWEGSRKKSESQFRGAHLQLASRKGEIHWNDSGNPGLKTKNKYKDLSDWTQEIRSYQFSLTLAVSLPNSLMILSWQLSSLRLLHLVRESKLPALGFYILKVSPSKERSSEPLEFKGIFWMMHLSSYVQP